MGLDLKNLRDAERGGGSGGGGVSCSGGEELNAARRVLQSCEPGAAAVTQMKQEEESSKIEGQIYEHDMSQEVAAPRQISPLSLSLSLLSRALSLYNFQSSPRSPLG